MPVISVSPRLYPAVLAVVGIATIAFFTMLNSSSSETAVILNNTKLNLLKKSQECSGQQSVALGYCYHEGEESHGDVVVYSVERRCAANLEKHHTNVKIYSLTSAAGDEHIVLKSIHNDTIHEHIISTQLENDRVLNILSYALDQDYRIHQFDGCSQDRNLVSVVRHIPGTAPVIETRQTVHPHHVYTRKYDNVMFRVLTNASDTKSGPSLHHQRSGKEVLLLAEPLTIDRVDIANSTSSNNRHRYLIIRADRQNLASGEFEIYMDIAEQHQSDDDDDDAVNAAWTWNSLVELTQSDIPDTILSYIVSHVNAFLSDPAISVTHTGNLLSISFLFLQSLFTLDLDTMNPRKFSLSRVRIDTLPITDVVKSIHAYRSPKLDKENLVLHTRNDQLVILTRQPPSARDVLKWGSTTVREDIMGHDQLMKFFSRSEDVYVDYDAPYETPMSYYSPHAFTTRSITSGHQISNEDLVSITVSEEKVFLLDAAGILVTLSVMGTTYHWFTVDNMDAIVVMGIAVVWWTVMEYRRQQNRRIQR